MDGTAFLIKQENIKDSLGIWQEPKETKQEIFVTVESASRAEFFKAAQTGNRCDFVFITSPLDYSGETVIEWNGRRYDIYRTYYNPKEDTMELYAEERAGVTDGGEQAENQNNGSV